MGSTIELQKSVIPLHVIAGREDPDSYYHSIRRESYVKEATIVLK